MKIEQEIQQTTFKDEYHKAHLNILFTASWMSKRTSTVLKPFNISWQQFNILRILKGQHPEPATVKDLTEKMIDKMSNSSRLVEKLMQKGLVDRKTCPNDRRRVDICITESGLDLVNQATQQVEREMTDFNSKISTQEAQMLNTILDKMRS